MKRLALAALFVVAAPALARADATAGPGMCVEYTPACGGCAQELCGPPLPPPDMAAPHPTDLSMPRDLAAPPDSASPGDARLERRRRQRAHGRGLVLLSGLTALAVVALRRRYRTMSPTPAESALAARATRSDS